MISTQLPVRAGGPSSALNLHGAEPHAFDDAARSTAAAFAVQAAAVLHGADEARNLTRALADRDMIGQAKGILMARFTVSDEEAFRMLVRSTQETNLKPVAVARWLVAEALERREGRGAATRGAESVPGGGG